MPRIAVSVPLSVGLGLLLAVACRADVGERCICADDCKSGLVCVSGGRQLRVDECIPAASDNEPGECVEDASAAEGDDDAGGGPGLYMDLGSKRDFDPGAPLPGSGSGSDSGTSGTGTTGTAGTGTTGTGTTGTGTGTGTGTTDSTGTAGSSSGTTGSSSTGNSSGSSTGM